ncbi:hypothetical protein [Campylobacter fetus]|nr:hypothetical protein [Campylobacter fetus]
MRDFYICVYLSSLTHFGSLNAFSALIIKPLNAKILNEYSND